MEPARPVTLSKQPGKTTGQKEVEGMPPPMAGFWGVSEFGPYETAT